MEAFSLDRTEEGSVGNPRAVKAGSSSPRSNGGRSSPPNCAICLGACENSSFTDSCLHQFCFNCLLTWSKVKAECPLCKQNFRSIIHNVRSLNQYEEYLVEQRQTDTQMINIDNISQTPPRFRYRTTLTLPRRESMAIQQLLELHYVSDLLPPTETGVRLPGAPYQDRYSRHRSPSHFRRTVYRHNLWARPLPDFTGRFRDCSPQFYRYNNAQMHRLVPWINRELYYLLNENSGHIAYVLSKILDLLPMFHINSPEFINGLTMYLGERTEHFVHELYCFASTPYDMTGYDRNVQYTTDPRVSTVINEIITSDSESSDSDIVLVSTPEMRRPVVVAGPSHPAEPTVVDLSCTARDPRPSAASGVIPIETISQSDSDDDNSEVMVIGYIKPPHERTPEVVDLLGSDSDVVLQDSVGEERPAAHACAAHPLAADSSPLVKVSLKRHRTSVTPPDTDSDTDRVVLLPRPARRRRSIDSATTVDTDRPTPTGSPTGSADPSWSPHRFEPSPLSSLPYDDTSSTSSDDCEPPAPRRRAASHKNKKKSKSRHRADATKNKTSADKRKSSKRKSKSRPRKDESSKKRATAKGDQDGPAVASDLYDVDQPSTSGLSRKTRKRSDSKDKSRRERHRSAPTEGGRRLKSVVSVPRHREDVAAADCSVIQSPRSTELPPHRPDDAYDSEDDLPLNLTVNRHS